MWVFFRIVVEGETSLFKRSYFLSEQRVLVKNILKIWLTVSTQFEYKHKSAWGTFPS